MNWQVARLVAEWVKHERIIIGVDFDDTICPFNLTGVEHTTRMSRTRTLLRQCIDLGARVVIHTTRSADRYDEVWAFCLGHGFHPEAINENLPGLPYGTSSKPYANIYLDDRAGIEAALDVLSAAYEIMRREKKGDMY